MPKVINVAEYIGKKYGRLTIISKAINLKNRKIKYIVKCDCGNIREVEHSNLVNGHTASCGCKKIEFSSKINLIHGLSKTPLYAVYKGIKARCYNKKSQFYHYYGGRGITMCQQWRTSYITFYNWCVENGYKKELQIDRRDNNGNYEPSNCRFVTPRVNSINRRNVHFIEYNGQQVPLIDLWVKSPVGRKAFYHRLKSGWSLDKALTDKPQPGVSLTEI